MLKKNHTIAILPPVFLGALGFLLLLIHSQGKFMGTDEGIWSYMGRIWAENGLVPYSGTINNKPPGIFLMYYLSHLLFGTNIWFPRLLGNLASLGTSLCLYRLVRKLSNRAAAAITMALYISLMPFGIFHAYSAAYTETFVIFFIVLAFMLLTAGSEQTGRWFGLTIFAAGVSAGAALSFKQMAALDILAMLLFAFALLKKEPQRKRYHEGVSADSAWHFIGNHSRFIGPGGQRGLARRLHKPGLDAPVQGQRGKNRLHKTAC